MIDEDVSDLYKTLSKSITIYHGMDSVMNGKANRISKWSDTFNEQLKYMYALTNRLSSQQFNFSPGAEQWSVGECIEHLNLSMRAYLNLMKPVIGRTNLKAKGDYAPGTMMGRLMLRALRKPGRRYPAPRSFIPAHRELDPDKVRDTFEKEIRRLQQSLENSYGLALGKVKMPWPVFRIIKISLAQAFKLQIIHNERHFKQAEKVIQSENFPSPKN